MTIPTTLPTQPQAEHPADRVRNELRTNRRAQLGLALIILLLAGYGCSLLRSATAQTEAQYRRDAQMLARIVAAEGEKDWPQRASDSAAALSFLNQRLWHAETEGVAQADLQAWVSNLGRELGLPLLDIRVEATTLKDFPPELRQITATIAAQPSETAVIDLLERLEQARRLTVVSRLHVRQRPSPVLELVLTGYARIEPSGRGGDK
jgi:hypothetical protein